MTSSIARVFRGRAVLAAFLVLVACGGGKSAPPPPPKLTAIALSPATVSLPKGSTLQVAAVGTYSDGSTRDVTAQATWSAGDPTVVTVAAGLVTGVAIGGSSVKATVDLIEGTGNAVVSAPTLTRLTLSPASASLPLGGVLKLVATASFGDGTTRDVSWDATWVSATPASVVVSGNGRALAAPGAVIGGTSVITASLGGMSATSTLTVAGRAAIGPGVSNDPLLGDEWYLKNTGQKSYADVGGTAGQDIATTTTYTEGWSGAGVKVGVVDTGLEIQHEDLAANVVPGSWNFVTGTSDPTSSLTTGDHGTAVGGLIAMVQGNGKGGMGVAPGAALNGYNFIASQSQSLAEEVASLGGSSANPKSDDVWIFNQSYGYDNTADFLVDPAEEAQYLSGVTTLRAGKGALYVKAAGNGFRSFGPSTAPADCASAKLLGTSCQNASMDPLNTLPYNVVVGAVNANGVKSSYSSAGSALWVAAPGGEFGLNVLQFPGSRCTGGTCPPYAYQPAMVTTDQSGCSAGWSVNTVETGSWFDDGNPPNTSCNYTATMNGTSSATPVTVGAIALILERNPNLGWRDVRHILASTATQVDPSRPAVTVPMTDPDVALRGYVAELPWATNAAGKKFHNWYGFGRVNVDAAVAMANPSTYVQLGALADTGWISSGTVNVVIPDASPTGAPSTITVPATPNLIVEAVQIKVSATHPYTGDLGIELTSPMGTKSILLNIRNGFNGTTGLNGMVLTSNAFYGESSSGNWTIKVVDGNGAHPAPTAPAVQALTNWQIRIYGH